MQLEFFWIKTHFFSVKYFNSHLINYSNIIKILENFNIIKIFKKILKIFYYKNIRITKRLVSFFKILNIIM